MNKVATLHVGAGLLGRERLVEDSHRVRVEVIADERDLLALRVARVQQMGHFQRPVGLRSLRSPDGTPTAVRQT